ncbi:hypothetical protein ACN3E9_11165 [Vibrio pectenicida]|uniref:hypothetical protein n=1 Tax=Vibrio pectenicida TaxID=62763 RepID=UPI003B9A4905
MAQQNSPLTRSIVNPATSVSPLGTKAHQKNDSSMARSVCHQAKDMRGALNEGRCGNKDALSRAERRAVMSERLQYLKMFSRGQTPEQKKDMALLKEKGIQESIKTQFPDVGQRVFKHHELYELLMALDSCIELGDWSLCESAQEVIVYVQFGSVFPGLRFEKLDEDYHCTGFNFNIRLAS